MHFGLAGDDDSRSGAVLGGRRSRDGLRHAWFPGVSKTGAADTPPAAVVVDLTPRSTPAPGLRLNMSATRLAAWQTGTRTVRIQVVDRWDGD